MDLTTRIQKLKSSFSVEGVPLIYSNRFSKKELDEMKANSKAHPYHWGHIKDNIIPWTNKEIGGQIDLFMSINLIEHDDFNNIVNNLLKRLPYKDKESEKDNFIKVLKIILQIENCVDVNVEFWKGFGSAPYFIESQFSNNETLLEYRKQYGACGMYEIFGKERFNIATSLIHGVDNAAIIFNNAWTTHAEILAMQQLKSDYNSLDDLENNVVARKIDEEARKFYHDKSKLFEERLKVFARYAEEDSCIYDPTDTDLISIFTYHTDGDMYQRHENVDTINIIESWINDLQSNRCKLDWENKYHPKLIKKKRNYTPSQAAIDRLQRYYLEKLMLEEVRCFELDW